MTKNKCLERGECSPNVVGDYKYMRLLSQALRIVWARRLISFSGKANHLLDPIIILLISEAEDGAASVAEEPRSQK